jgi:hypothetical protein
MVAWYYLPQQHMIKCSCGRITVTQHGGEGYLLAGRRLMRRETTMAAS